MSDDTWRPLGVDDQDEIAAYDALHDGIPSWMTSAFWAWIRDSLTAIGHYSDGSGRFDTLDTALTEAMCQRLRIPLPDVRSQTKSVDGANTKVRIAMAALTKHDDPLQVADYLLAHSARANPEEINALLGRSKSAWEVGTRAGKPGLVRRVPLGVQVAATSVMASAGRAGTRLARAWEELYGLQQNASDAYRLAILAVEDVTVPVVSPVNKSATLGTVLRQIEDQGNWQLPMDREHDDAPSSAVLAGMMRLLWHGQHDRHGGQPSAPGNVSIEEATVAVSLAVALVTWFDACLVSRSG
jgi:hypothetical protein